MTLKNIYRFLIIVLLSSRQTFGQEKPNDDLSVQLSSATQDSDKINILNKLTDEYSRDDSAKAFGYARLGLSLALKDRNDVATYRFYRTLGLISKSHSNFSLALTYFNDELTLAQQKKDVSHIVAAYKDIGVMLQDESKYAAAQDAFFKALSISENDKDHPYICLLYADIASTYSIENQIAKTKEYAQKALSVRGSTDTTALTKALELLGVVYKQTYEAQKFEARKSIDTLLMDSARYYYNRALLIYQAGGNTTGQASMYMQIGSTYEDTYANDIKSLDYCLRSKAIWDKTDPTSSYALYNMDNLANDYWAMAKTLDTMPYIKNRRALQDSLAAKGEKYFKEALVLSKKSANNVSSLYALNNLAHLFAFEHKYSEAYDNMEQYAEMHDSTFSQENADKIVALEAQQKVEVRDRQLEISKLEIANRKRLTLVLAIGLFFLLAVAIYIYLQDRNRKRKNAILANLNSQLAHANKINTQFFSILHHDLRGPVTGVINLLHLQKNDPDLLDERNREQYFNRITGSAEHLLASMEDLLIWSKGQMENFKPQFSRIAVKDLFGFIQKTFESSDVKISFELGPDFMQLHTDGNFLRTIMLNLTTNAVHALADASAPKIVWKAWQTEEYSYLSISDNGPGATSEQLRPLYDDSVPIGIKNGLGLHIVRDMAKAIGCTLDIDPNVEKGVEIVVGVKRTTS